MKTSIKIVLAVLATLAIECIAAAALVWYGKVTVPSVDMVKNGVTVIAPDATEYLTGYPAFEDKDLFFNDSLLYEQGKAIRNTERGALAVKDADASTEYFLERFGNAMGRTLTQEKYPKLTEYINATKTFARASIQSSKQAYGRTRPYAHFNEPSGVPDDESALSVNSSYPSGHTVRAWAVALALCAIDNEHSAEIIKAGYEIGQSRVIAGFHFQSDVDAARLVASVTFASLCGDMGYVAMMQEAAAELSENK